jgi:hypothetical protein
MSSSTEEDEEQREMLMCLCILGERRSALHTSRPETEEQVLLHTALTTPSDASRRARGAQSDTHQHRGRAKHHEVVKAIARATEPVRCGLVARAL